MGGSPAFIERMLNLVRGNMTENEHDSAVPSFHPTAVALVAAAVFCVSGWPRCPEQSEMTSRCISCSAIIRWQGTASPIADILSCTLPAVSHRRREFHLLIGDFETASNLVYALCGGLLLFPVFAMARRIYGVKTAWLTPF
jgi:hypothetical protein